MYRTDPIAALYGYGVCFICVVIIIFSAGHTIGSLVALANPSAVTPMPMHGGMYGMSGPMHAPMMTQGGALHALLASLVVLIVSIGFFIFHWRWLRTGGFSDSSSL
jgi:hypothetical protein